MIAVRDTVPFPRRRGMSLIEILVVISIIALLTALAAWGAFAVIGTRQRDNTQATFKLLNKLMQDRWQGVIDDAKKEKPSAQVLALAGGDVQRAQVIWIKVRLCEAFPMAYKEMNPEIGVVPQTTIVNVFIPPNMIKPHFAKYRSLVTAYPAVPGPTESAACLLMALNTLQAGTGGVSTSDQLKASIADTDGDGLPELIDGWGRSVTFFRFPWNNADLQASNPAPAGSRNKIYADPIDTGGTLINAVWYNLPPPAAGVPPPRVAFESIFHSVTYPAPPTAGQPLMASYVTPVIVSSGKDGVLGLNGDLSLMAGTASADNIYSYKVNN